MPYLDPSLKENVQEPYQLPFSYSLEVLLVSLSTSLDEDDGRYTVTSLDGYIMSTGPLWANCRLLVRACSSTPILLQVLIEDIRVTVAMQCLAGKRLCIWPSWQYWLALLLI